MQRGFDCLVGLASFSKLATSAEAAEVAAGMRDETQANPDG